MKKANSLLAKWRVFPVVFFMPVLFFYSCNKSDSPAPNTVPPNASFAYTSARVFPVQVQFLNQSTSPFPGPSTYSWNFGNGSNSTAINPIASYPAEGTYLIQLIQTYSNNSKDTVALALQLLANGPAGVSTKTSGINATNFSFSIPSVYLVTFTNNSTNADSYFWDFGDAGTSTSGAATVTHQYNAAGPFSVILRATGPGGTDTCSARIVF